MKKFSLNFNISKWHFVTIIRFTNDLSRMKHVGFLAIFLLPLIVVFDGVQYLLQRSTCMTCGNIPQFIAQSSLAAHTIGQVWSTIKLKAKS
jgi:hypothetical protein